MIFQGSSPPAEFTTDYPWKSPLPKRSNFDRVLTWLLVVICGCVAAGIGLIILVVFFEIGLHAVNRGGCGGGIPGIAFEQPQLEDPLLTIQSFDGSFGNLAWEVKVENPAEGRSYHLVSYSLDGETYKPADFNNGEISIRIDDPQVIDSNRLYIKYETDEGRSGGPLVYELNFRAYIDALRENTDRNR